MQLNHPFKIRDFKLVHEQSAKHAQGLRDLDIEHDYGSFDLVIFSKWFLAYVNETKIDLSKTDVDLYTVQTQSALR